MRLDCTDVRVAVIMSITTALVSAATAAGQTLSSVTFATTQPLPVLRVSPEMRPLRMLLAQGVGRVLEGKLLLAAVTAGQRPLRLTPQQVQTLRSGLSDVYARIDADPLFNGVHSALADAVADDPH